MEVKMNNHTKKIIELAELAKSINNKSYGEISNADAELEKQYKQAAALAAYQKENIF